jgi:hypothetical protein
LINKQIRLDKMLAAQAADAYPFKEFSACGHPPCGWALVLVFAKHSVKNINEQEATQFYNIFAATSLDKARAVLETAGDWE